MATIIIYHDTRGSREDSPAPLKIAVNQNSKSAYIPLNVKVTRDQWDNKAKMVKDHPNKRFLNTLIIEKRAAAERALLEIDERLPVRELRDRVAMAIYPEKKALLDKTRTFLYRWDRFLSLKTKPKTIEGYTWTRKKLLEYDPELETRTFEDITVDYINDFLGTLTDVNRNTRNVHLRYIKAVFNDAIKAGITTFYPFKAIPIRPLPVRKKALTPDQMRALLNYPCDRWQREYRDMFVLMFLLRGVNIGDMLHATPDQVVDGRLEYRRSKVGSLFSVKIEPEAWDIIDRYRGKSHLLSPLDRYKSHNDYLHHLNHALKTIGMDTGKHGEYVGEPLFPGLSSNWARHTWATTGARLDIPQETISKGMGHSFGVAVTNVYIDYDMKKVDKANREIIDFIFHSSQ